VRVCGDYLLVCNCPRAKKFLAGFFWFFTSAIHSEIDLFCVYQLDEAHERYYDTLFDNVEQLILVLLSCSSRKKHAVTIIVNKGSFTSYQNKLLTNAFGAKKGRDAKSLRSR